MMAGRPGWTAHQRSIEELAKLDAGLTRPPGSGPGGHEPRPPRTWRGAAGILGVIGTAILLVLVLDCANPNADPTPSSEPASPAPTVDTALTAGTAVGDPPSLEAVAVEALPARV